MDNGKKIKIDKWLEKNIFRFNTVVGVLMTLLVFTHTYFNGQINTNFREVLVKLNYLNSTLISNTSNYTQAHLNLDLLVGLNCLQCNQNCSEECIYRKNNHEDLRKKIELGNTTMIKAEKDYEIVINKQKEFERKNNPLLKISSYGFFLIAFLSIFTNSLFFKKINKQ